MDAETHIIFIGDFISDMLHKPQVSPNMENAYKVS